MSESPAGSTAALEHATPSATGRIRVLYAGRDTLVRTLLEHMPFVAVESVDCGPDGTCPVRDMHDALRADAVLIDEHPGDASPLDVVKSVKGQAPDLPTIVLTSTQATDVESAAFDLEADDVIVRTGVFRRRLMATLERVHRQHETARLEAAMRGREIQARRVLEALPIGVVVVDASGVVLMTNGCARQLFGLSRPAEAAGRSFRTLVASDHREAVDVMVERVFQGAEPRLEAHTQERDGSNRRFGVRALVLNAPDAGERRAVLVVESARDRPSDEAELARLRAALEDREAEREATSQTLAAARMDWTREREVLERRVERLQEVDRVRETLERALADTRTELERARKDLGTFEARLEAAKTDVEAARAAERGLREQHAAALADNDRRVQEAREAHITERAHLQATLDVAREQLERLRGEHRQAETDLRRVLERQTAGEQHWQARRQHLDEHLRAAVQALATEASARSHLAEALESIGKLVDNGGTTKP